MLKIDKETKFIYMTRGDAESVVFSAKDDEGEAFHPTVNDRLVFSAAKNWGDDPLLQISNTMVDDEEDWWTIEFEPEDTKPLEFKKYVYDVQIEMRNSETGELEKPVTIIGKTDKLNPMLVIWGEVS